MTNSLCSISRLAPSFRIMAAALITPLISKDFHGNSLRKSQNAVGAATGLTSMGSVFVPANQHAPLLLSPKQLQPKRDARHLI
jgi:hypothetical protein